MNRCILILLIITVISCSSKHGSTLEMNFTSKNGDTILEIKSFYLTSLTEMKKPVSFTNIKSIAPNKFKFDNLPTGFFIGLLQLEKAGRMYNVSVDSIFIKEGINMLSKEINLGTVRL